MRLRLVDGAESVTAAFRLFCVINEHKLVLDISQSELVSRIALTVDDFSQMPDWLRAPTDVIGDLFKAMG